MEAKNGGPSLHALALENRRRLTSNEFDHVNLFEDLDSLSAAVADHVEDEDNVLAELVRAVQRLTETLEQDE